VFNEAVTAIAKVGLGVGRPVGIASAVERPHLAVELRLIRAGRQARVSLAHPEHEFHVAHYALDGHRCGGSRRVVVAQSC
jgi:hypothetical protein